MIGAYMYSGEVHLRFSELYPSEELAEAGKRLLSDFLTPTLIKCRVKQLLGPEVHKIGDENTGPEWHLACMVILEETAN